MKKEYIKPFSKTYFVSPVHMVAVSFKTDDDNIDGEDTDVGDAREDNTDNSNNGGNSIWDNVW